MTMYTFTITLDARRPLTQAETDNISDSLANHISLAKQWGFVGYNAINNRYFVDVARIEDSNHAA